ncbi:hypothetical protein QP162_08345 [Sphingomonas aurantiaca]
MDPTGVILSANPAALAMHGVKAVEDLGDTADAYASRFRLRYRDRRTLPRRDYPLMRLLKEELPRSHCRSHAGRRGSAVRGASGPRHRHGRGWRRAGLPGSGHQRRVRTVRCGGSVRGDVPRQPGPRVDPARRRPALCSRQPGLS